MAKVYEQGCSDLRVGILGEAGFGDTTVAISGVVGIEFEVQEAKGKISADDDPAYLKLKGPAMGEGTLTLTGIEIDDYALLTSAILGANKVIAVGEHTDVKEVGFSYKKAFFTDGVKQTNMVMMHCIVFGTPQEGSTSIDEEGIEITDCQIPFEIFPAFYLDGTTKKRRTYTKLNSAKSTALYDALKDVCFTPADALITT